jgi:hypothetical protein
VRECLTLQELLASDMTRAVLRADALEMRCFEATLQAATKRVRARHSKTQPTQKAAMLVIGTQRPASNTKPTRASIRLALVEAALVGDKASLWTRVRALWRHTRRKAS